MTLFYYPNRIQAQKIQKTLETLYAGVNGEYHYGDNAWSFMEQYTNINLKKILETIALERINDS